MDENKVITIETAKTESDFSALIFQHKNEDFNTFMESVKIILHAYKNSILQDLKSVKRIQIATAAMQGLINNPNWEKNLEIAQLNTEEGLRFTAKASFMFADELLRQENE